MLTGVEIAGLVLATIPLLISAAEHRHDVFNPVCVLFFENRTLPQVLEEERISFRQCCEKMLSVAEVENIADYVLGENCQKLWARAELRAKLQSALGNDFNTIETRLQEIHELTDKLEKYINSNRLIRSGWSKSQAEDLKKLRETTERIQNILDREELSAKVRSIPGSWATEISAIEVLRERFIALHNGVDNSWGCNCSEQHLLMFVLRPESSKLEHWVLLAPTLLSEDVQKPTQPTWTLRGLKVSSSGPGPSTTQKIGDLCALLDREAIAMRQANHAILPPVTWRNLSETAHVQCCVDDHGCPFTRSGQQEVLSLQGALKQPTSRTPLFKRKSMVFALSPRQRFILGATLLQAVLHHHSTHWLSSTWDTTNVFLMAESARNSPDNTIVALLAAQFPKPANPAPGSAQNATVWRPCHVRNIALHNLAIILIELAYGKQIEDLMHEDEERGGLYGRELAIERLAEELPAYFERKARDEMVKEAYCAAVNGCLTANFGLKVKGKQLSDHDLFCAVYREAVKPLIDALKIQPMV